MQCQTKESNYREEQIAEPFKNILKKHNYQSDRQLPFWKSSSVGQDCCSAHQLNAKEIRDFLSCWKLSSVVSNAPFVCVTQKRTKLNKYLSEYCEHFT